MIPLSQLVVGALKINLMKYCTYWKDINKASKKTLFGEDIVCKSDQRNVAHTGPGKDINNVRA